MLTSTKLNAGLEGRTPAPTAGAVSIETTNFKIFLISLQPIGLDTAEERCLLDQRIAPERDY
jgi:hypothetical protein